MAKLGWYEKLQRKRERKIAERDAKKKAGKLPSRNSLWDYEYNDIPATATKHYDSYGGYYDEFGAYHYPDTGYRYIPARDYAYTDTKYNYGRYSLAGNRADGVGIEYVEKMASALSASYQIEVRSADNWKIDLENKILYYDPDSLAENTDKSRVLSGLLHEIGHLRHSTSSKQLKSPYYPKYKDPAFLVIDCFEDFRIDDLMVKSYPSAYEVYEGMTKDLNARIKQQEEVEEMAVNMLIGKGLTVDAVKVNKLMPYLRLMMAKNYDLTLPKGEIYDDAEIQDVVAKTKDVIALAINSKDNQAVVDLLNERVFPLVKQWMIDFPKQPNGQKIAGDGAGDGESMDGESKMRLRAGGGYGNSKDRWSAGRNDPYPVSSKLLKGAYIRAKDSMHREIAQLTRYLRALRTYNQAERYKARERRGRLDVKNIYKYRLDDARIFKRKADKIDYTSDIAFSLIVDASGSMWHPTSRIVGGKEPTTGQEQASKAITVILEATAKLDIPLEIVYYSNKGYTAKKFTDLKAIKAKNLTVALTEQAYITIDGKAIDEAFGQDNYEYTGFDISEIGNRPEGRKVVIFISDGAFYYKNTNTIGGYASDTGQQNAQSIDKLKAKGNVKIVGVGVGSGIQDRIMNLAVGEKNYIKVPDMSELPRALIDVIKSSVKRR